MGNGIGPNPAAVDCHQLLAMLHVLPVEQSDVDLVAESLKGDRDAFGQLVDRYQKVVFNIALRMVGSNEDAQDITQSVFLKAYDKLDTFSPHFRFFSWIYRIAVNESINHLERRRGYDQLNENLESPGESAEQMVYVSELGRMLEKAMLKLSVEYRTVLILRHLQDLTYQEIAETLGLTEKKVKSRLFTARRLMCDILTEKGVSEND